jgi:hypothetical protein
VQKVMPKSLQVIMVWHYNINLKANGVQSTPYEIVSLKMDKLRAREECFAQSHQNKKGKI